MSAISQETRSWTEEAGHNWVAAQALMDRMLAPYLDRLMASVAALKRGRVLDIGCGTGATTRAAAHILGDQGDAVGLDVSPPMIEAARALAAEEEAAARFILDDAATHAFDAGSFDLLISRFGVMFFEAPAEAFAHLRQAVRAGGAMHLLTWRAPEENPFMLVAEDAAREFLPDLPVRKGGEPGQFGLCDRDAVEAMLLDAGWQDIRIEPADEICTVTRDELETYLVRLGPVGRLFAELEADVQQALSAAIRQAFAPYIEGDLVRFTAACWSIRARQGVEQQG